MASFAAAADAAVADPSTLELAWEIASEAAPGSSSGPIKPLSLSEMSELLYDARDARSLLITHRLMAADRVYFKQVLCIACQV